MIPKGTKICDFETTTEDPVRVWLWCYYDSDTSDYYYGDSIHSFLNSVDHGSICWFHNLKFDIAFIADYCLRNGIMILDEIISEMNKVYLFTIYYAGKVIEFHDSLNKIPMSVQLIGQKTDKQKGTIDYSAANNESYQPSAEDYAYIKRDVDVIKNVLIPMLDKGYDHLTIGSDSFSLIKRELKRLFREWFPVLDIEEDTYIRRALRGGYCYVKNNCVQEGTDASSYDVVSLYPSIMRNDYLPYGKPYPCKDHTRPGFYRFLVGARLTAGGTPTISSRNSGIFSPDKYIVNTNGVIELVASHLDIDSIFSQYNVDIFQVIDGMAFDVVDGIFSRIIDELFYMKDNAKTDVDKLIAKLLLNNLYGKMVSRTVHHGKHYELINNIAKPVLNEFADECEPYYTPFGAMVTSIGRHSLVDKIASVFDRFLYCDTDSIHVKGKGLPWETGNKLGMFMHENDIRQYKYIRPKCYMYETYKGDTIIKCSGMPSRVAYDAEGAPRFGFDDFKIGGEYPGKLYSKRVPGGIILEEGIFTLREV